VQLIDAFERAKHTEDVKELVKLIGDYGLTREMVPTQMLTKAEVWEALFQKMPLGAMVRNLGNMSKCDLLKPLSETAKETCARLTNQEALKKARLHPLQLLVALNTYKGGQGVRGKGNWTPVPKVLDALEEAFYLSFDNIEPTGKRFLLCLDTSGSMTWGWWGGQGGGLAGMPGISPRIGSAVMAMVTARTETDNLFISYSDKASELPFTHKWTLQEVITRIERHPAYHTDCAAPIEHAIERKYDVDTIILYTDSETNARGKRQPVVALRDLRQKLGHDVKFVVVGMVSNGFSVADPDDASMLDCVGFSTSTPAVISEFSKGNI
jgi:60 kDa SS-A/Ro ribonucleoprotein